MKNRFVITLLAFFIVSCSGTSTPQQQGQKKQLGMLPGLSEDPECYKDTKLVEAQPGKPVGSTWGGDFDISDFQYTCFSENGINYFWTQYPSGLFLYWPQPLLYRDGYDSMASKYCKREYDKRAVYVGKPNTFVTGYTGLQYTCK